MRVAVDDSDIAVVYSDDGWTTQGTSQDFNRTTHATCLPGSSLTLEFSGRFVSVFGTISNTSQATLWHAVDNDNQTIFTTPWVSQDIHQALLFTQGNLDDGDHTIEVSLINSTATPSHEGPCLSIDFFAYHLPRAPPAQTCDTDRQHHDMQAQPGTPGRSDRAAHSHGGGSSSHEGTLKIALIVGLVVGALFLAVGCIGFLLLWHKRRRNKWQTLKEEASRTSSATTGPISPMALGAIAPFLGGRPSPRRPSTSATPAGEGAAAGGTHSLQRTHTTLPPYPQSEGADRVLPNPRQRKIDRV